MENPITQKYFQALKELKKSVDVLIHRPKLETDMDSMCMNYIGAIGFDDCLDCVMWVISEQEIEEVIK